MKIIDLAQTPADDPRLLEQVPRNRLIFGQAGATEFSDRPGYSGDRDVESQANYRPLE
jgi:hypothetical protein